MKKRIVSVWLVLCMVLALLPTSVQAVETEETWLKTDENGAYCYADFSPFTDPKASEYIISTAEQLAGLAALANVLPEGETEILTDKYGISVEVEKYKTWNVKLSADINLAEHEWVPIGYWQDPGDNPKPEDAQIKSFEGNFDGEGHTVDGMYIGTEEAPAQWSCAGLFGFCDGNIKNVVIGSNSAIYSGKGMSDVGGVCGLFYGGVMNGCENNAKVVAAVASTDDFAYGGVGGVCGMVSHGRIINCSNRGTVENKKTKGLISGGICGGVSVNGESIVANCYNVGEIVVDSGVFIAGGVCGEVSEASTVANCYNVGVFTSEGTYNTIVGGVCGTAGGRLDPVIENCYFPKDLAVPGIGENDTSKVYTTTAMPDTQILAAAGTASANDWAEIEINGEAKGRLALVEALNAGAEAFEKEHPEMELLRWTVNEGTPEFGTEAPVYAAALEAQQIEGTDAVRLLATVEGGTAPYTYRYLFGDDMGRWAVLRDNAAARYIVHPSAVKKQTFCVLVTDAKGNEARAYYEVNGE